MTIAQRIHILTKLMRRHGLREYRQIHSRHEWRTSENLRASFRFDKDAAPSFLNHDSPKTASVELYIVYRATFVCIRFNNSPPFQGYFNKLLNQWQDTNIPPHYLSAVVDLIILYTEPLRLHNAGQPNHIDTEERTPACPR